MRAGLTELLKKRQFRHTARAAMQANRSRSFWQGIKGKAGEQTGEHKHL